MSGFNTFFNFFFILSNPETRSILRFLWTEGDWTQAAR